MANNLLIGANSAVANSAADGVTFADAGLTSANMLIIYEVGNPNKSFVPGRSINAITVFTATKGYYIVMFAAADLSTFLIPPIPAAGDVYSDPQGYTTTDGQTDFTVDAFDGKNPPASAGDYRVLINGLENTNGINGFSISVGSLVGSQRTLTISPAVSSIDGVAIQYKL